MNGLDNPYGKLGERLNQIAVENMKNEVDLMVDAKNWENKVTADREYRERQSLLAVEQGILNNHVKAREESKAMADRIEQRLNDRRLAEEDRQAESNRRINDVVSAMQERQRQTAEACKADAERYRKKQEQAKKDEEDRQRTISLMRSMEQCEKLQYEISLLTNR